MASAHHPATTKCHEKAVNTQLATSFGCQYIIEVLKLSVLNVALT